MYIGIDLGGTNLKYGVIDSVGNILFQSSQSTNPNKGPADIIHSIKNQVKYLLNRFPQTASIGMGVPGIITDDGIVLIAPNLQGWENLDLLSEFKNDFDLPVAIDNDANTAALAELELGAGKSEKSFFYLTLGTGAGGSIILNRKLFRGTMGGAGEIGYIIIDACTELNNGRPYRTGILEEYVGKNQIAALGMEIMKSYPDSLLFQYPRPDPYFISLCVDKNDEAAIKIFQKTGYYLGLGLASMMNLLDISLIIVGGGISLAHPLLIESALETIRQRAIPTIAGRAEIRKAFFSKDAGIVGAALLGKMSINR
jgi:glucokinase